MPALLPWPIQQVAAWMPIWQAAGFFLATFILEDAATIGAGVLLAAGAVAWPVAFPACFLGIWTGDAGLYAIARCGGRKWFERSALRRFAKRVETSERWFAERGLPVLIFSRLLPGARLPTYLAAGFLRVPFRRFLAVTGAASFLWTVALLWLVQAVGVRVLGWLGVFRAVGWGILAVVLTLWGGVYFARRLALKMNFSGRSAALGRWRRWEFWPPWMFYPPVALYCLWLAIRHRGLTLPTVANPGMFCGGMVGESKMATLAELLATSPRFTADASLVAGATPAERCDALEQIRERMGIPYPFILKPDVGQRGAGVKLIRSAEQAREYLRRTDAPLVVQRYAAGPFEAGVFYYRFPGEPRGRIFAITEKIFPSITGDGHSTAKELVWRDARARFMAGKYLERLGGQRGRVPAAGESVRLVETGNHAQGCIFRDGIRLRTPELESRMDEISQKLTGFFIGRYDVRYSSETDLRAGRDFQIVELNGASSEATSIYDARNTLFDAYRTLFRQWDLVFTIGAANRERGCAPASLAVIWRQWRDYSRTAATYPAAD
jgi:membrane protein DedA with SNARE-associated domain